MQLKVSTRGVESEWFQVRVGLRLWCVMSPRLFNMDGEVREVNAGVIVLRMSDKDHEWDVSQIMFSD